jgi:hypothetical protein
MLSAGRGALHLQLRFDFWITVDFPATSCRNIFATLVWPYLPALQIHLKMHKFAIAQIVCRSMGYAVNVSCS